MRSACSSSLNTRDARRLKAGAGASAAGWWCLAGSGLDKITDLVDQPEAVTAQQLIGGGPVPGERISDLARGCGNSHLTSTRVRAWPHAPTARTGMWHVRKNEAPGPCDIRELRGCSCQGLEQHHQDTTLKFGATPDGPSRSAYLHWEQAKTLAAAIVAVPARFGVLPAG